MYNRYIPQPDGSFRRSRVPDTQYSPPQPVEEESQYFEPEAEFCPPQTSQESFCPEPQKSNPQPSRRKPPQRPQHCQQRSQNQRQRRQEPSAREHRQEKSSDQVNSFLRNLLPKDFDTADLLIVLLLLLMAGDGKEDRNSALLTLALYFFM